MADQVETTPAGEEDRSLIRMWYRFLTYREDANLLSLEVDVMAEGPDIVYVPSDRAWRETAPAFARDRRDVILSRMKAIKWNRDLEWEESDDAACSEFDPRRGGKPGSIESTPAGRLLEESNLFGSKSNLSFEQAREVWKYAEINFVAGASGRVTLRVSNARPNSMFTLVSLPALKRNPNVTLIFQ